MADDTMEEVMEFVEENDVGLFYECRHPKDQMDAGGRAGSDFGGADRQCDPGADAIGTVQIFKFVVI